MIVVVVVGVVVGMVMVLFGVEDLVMSLLVMISFLW